MGSLSKSGILSYRRRLYSFNLNVYKVSFTWFSLLLIQWFREKRTSRGRDAQNKKASQDHSMSGSLLQIIIHLMNASAWPALIIDDVLCVCVPVCARACGCLSVCLFVCARLPSRKNHTTASVNSVTRVAFQLTECSYIYNGDGMGSYTCKMCIMHTTIDVLSMHDTNKLNK